MLLWLFTLGNLWLRFCQSFWTRKMWVSGPQSLRMSWWPGSSWGIVSLEVYSKSFHRLQHPSVAASQGPRYGSSLSSLTSFSLSASLLTSVSSLLNFLDSVPTLHILTLRIFQVSDSSPLFFPYVIPSQSQDLASGPSCICPGISWPVFIIWLDFISTMFIL